MRGTLPPMTAELVLGPLLRYTGAHDATVWVETASPCEVGVTVDGSSHRARTFCVEDHHYALVRITDLEPGSSYEYSVALDGDEVSAGTQDFIRSRRDPDEAPGDEGVRDFEEYTHLYWDSWSDPTIRWLLSTVPSAMIFDDHDVNDDWNTSETWVRQMREKSWWEERIIGAFMSYWIYQHLGNLSPEELEQDGLFKQVQRTGDATHALREFAYRSDREVGASRWSFHRDFGKVRLIMMDSRAGRILKEESRSMLDGAEWAWIEDKATGEFDHLLFGTSLPFLLSPGLHHLEAWNEAVCKGAWGRPAAWLGEGIRQLF